MEKILLHTCKVFIFSCLLMTFFAASAAEPQSSLRVGVLISPPFAMQQGSFFSGISVDLWRMLEAEINTHSTYVSYSIQDIGKAYQDLKSGKIDVLLGNTPVSSATINSALYSRPYFVSELGLAYVETRLGVFPSILRFLFHYQLKLLITFFIVLLLYTTVHFYYTQKAEGKLKTKTSLQVWGLDLFQNASAFFALSDKTKTPTTLLRVLLIFWYCFGIVFVSTLTAELAAAFTQSTNNANHFYSTDNQLTSAIVFSSNANEFARIHNNEVRRVNSFSEAFDLLTQNHVDNVLDDYMLLKYYLKKHEMPNVNLMLLPAGSNEIAVAVSPKHPKLLHKIDVALLQLEDRRQNLQPCVSYLSTDELTMCLI